MRKGRRLLGVQQGRPAERAELCDPRSGVLTPEHAGSASSISLALGATTLPTWVWGNLLVLVQIWLEMFKNKSAFIPVLFGKTIVRSA